MNTIPQKTSFVLAAAAGIGLSLTSCDKKSSTTLQSQPAPTTAVATSNDEVLSRIAKQIADILKKPSSEITPEKHIFSDLGADSLDAVEIVMALEEEFRISIDDASAERMRTVGDIISYIESQPKP